LATVAFLLSLVGLWFLGGITGANLGNHADNWGVVVSFLYLTFSRPLWAMCWGVITLLCYYDHLPLTNAVLSHGSWSPLARLSYGAYLLHPLVIMLAAGNAVQYETFDTASHLFRSWSYISCALALSVVLWCMVERPMSTLMSKMLKKPKKDETQVQSIKSIWSEISGD